jgi:hexosaminidase
LFPGKYIHIGGDECPKDTWKASAFCQNLIKQLNLKDEHGLQSYFIQRMEKYINSKGKQIIGWDEILEGGLAPNATVMSWRGNEGGIEAAKQKHDVIMTPESHCYFDYYQSDNESEPLAIGGLTTLDKVYNWEVIPAELDRRNKKYILGGQANLWTEYINNYSYLEYMAFSRGMAMSEALWSDAKTYKNFLKRYEKHNNYLKSKGVNIANHLYDIKANPTATADGSIDVTFEGLDGMKVLCADDKGGNKMVKIDEKYTIKSSGKYTFTGIKGDKTGKSVRINIELHKGTTAKITSEQQPSEKYFGGGINALANGIEGSDAKYGGNEWLGFEGTDCNLLFELPQSDSIGQVDFRFFKGEGQWIYLPKSLKVSLSEDNKTFNDVFVSDSIVADGKVAKIRASFPKSAAKYLKIQITNHGVIAEGRPGAGHKAWLFVDEIRVE